MATVISSHPQDSTEPMSPTDSAQPETDVDAWSEEELEEESLFASEETTALTGSMLVHLIIILVLALVPLRPRFDDVLDLASAPEAVA